MNQRSTEQGRKRTHPCWEENGGYMREVLRPDNGNVYQCTYEGLDPKDKTKKIKCGYERDQLQTINFDYHIRTHYSPSSEDIKLKKYIERSDEHKKRVTTGPSLSVAKKGPPQRFLSDRIVV